MYVYGNLKLADNAIGMTQAAGDIGSLPFSSRLVNGLVVGETDNIGNPVTPEEIAYGRSLPKPSIPDFPIRGYEYYDYRDDVVNTTAARSVQPLFQVANAQTGLVARLQAAAATPILSLHVPGTVCISRAPNARQIYPQCVERGEALMAGTTPSSRASHSGSADPTGQ